MCGLAGIIMKQQARSNYDLAEIKSGFQTALTNAQVRGTHATGFAMVDSDFDIIKRPVSASEFFTYDDVNDALQTLGADTRALIGHTRYATQGRPHINSNNHPIRAGRIIGTHNGWVSNDNQLFKQFDLYRFAEVDSEVIFRMANDTDDVDEFVHNRFTKIRGKATIVWHDIERPEYVYIIKGNNPLEIAFHKRLNLLVYGSTWDIIKDAFSSTEIQRVNVKENHFYRVNTNTMEIRKAKVDTNFSELDRYLYKSPTKSGVYAKTHARFVPRFSYRDKQEDIFKNVKASDGSTIRRVK